MIPEAAGAVDVVDDTSEEIDPDGDGTPEVPGAGLPATGQVTAYAADKNDGVVGAVAVDDDGTLQRGASAAFVDNGDGTVTDPRTSLTWEKKSDDGSLHDWDGVYVWSGTGVEETVWDWLDDVNAEGGTGFAGHDDWRIPNRLELESILDLEATSPAAVATAFADNCLPGCTVTTCSCTASDFYWSSSTFAPNTAFARRINFDDGGSGAANKSGLFRVCAVRGGS